MNVLIVEDDAISMKLIHLVLEDKGLRVTNVDHPEKAFEAIQKEKPGVILMDLVLPGMDGLALTRLLKKDPDTRSIPVIAITSHPDQFPRQEALDAGCDAYIVKPINTRTLPGLVTQIGGGNIFNEADVPERK